MDLDIKGLRVLVTAGANGIGLAIARRFATEGAKVHTCDVDEMALSALAASDPTITSTPCDISDRSAVKKLFAEATAKLGGLDVLVNNAGIAESAPLSRTDAALWDRHFRVNVTGPYLLSRAVLPGMLERKWGRVINVASLAGLYGAPYVTAYTASKHALVGFTRALAAEVFGKGVTVNAVCPGYVATDLVWGGARNIAARTGQSFEAAVAAMAAMNPGRRLLEPEEVAEAAVRLVRDETTNGQALVLDGTGPVPARQP